MSEINLQKGSLRSQVVREIIGERTIDIYRELTTDPKKDDQSGAIGWAIGLVSRLVGFVINAIPSITSLIGSIVRWVLSTVIFVANFDWNAADADLESQMKANNLLIAAALGQLVGGGGAWLISIGAAAGAAVYYPVLGGKVALELAEEGGDEIRGLLRNFCNQTGRALTHNLAYYLYLNGRRAVRKALGRNPTVATGGEPWTIAGQIENAVQAIGGDWLRTFVEEALEEAADAFFEAGFIISTAIDDHFEAARLAQQQMLGEQRVIKMEPDNQTDEFFIASGEQKLLKQQIQTTLNTFKMVHNREVGLIMGQPLEELVRAQPQSLRIVIDMYSVQKPPFYRNVGNNFVWATITIPDCKRSHLDWQHIKNACGGAHGYLWGRFRAIAHLNNGRKLVVYAGSEQDAEERIKAMLDLTNAEMVTLNITEELKQGERLKKEKLYKPNTKIYPGYFTVINREQMLDTSQGRASTRQNNYRDVKTKIPLWTDKEPSNAQSMINNLLRRGF